MALETSAHLLVAGWAPPLAQEGRQPGAVQRLAMEFIVPQPKTMIGLDIDIYFYIFI